MDSQDRKKVRVITEYATEFFSEREWYALGHLTGALPVIQGHGRLLRSLSFGDDDYSYCVSEVLNQIFEKSPETIDQVIDNFDIDIWYEQKDPRKYHKLLLGSATKPPDFWGEGYLKAFVSHLSTSKNKVSRLKSFLGQWGISAFIAHEDIVPSREWQKEIEAALDTMDLMIVVVEPGLKDSDWCCQEVGYALGKKVDILPLRSDLDPFGLFGKYQGIQAKSKRSSQIAEEVVNLLLRKPRHRNQLLLGISKSFTSASSQNKIQNLRLLDSWKVLSDEQMRALLQRVSLSPDERVGLEGMILRTNAFDVRSARSEDDDSIPF